MKNKVLKVSDLANEFGKRPRDFIKILLDLGIRVKSENTRLDSDTLQLVRELLSNEEAYMNNQIQQSKTITFSKDDVTILDFCSIIDASMNDVMGVVLKKGLLLNRNSVIDASLAKDIAADLGITMVLDTEDVDQTVIKDAITNMNDAVAASGTLRSRPPVVTVMGHVDHGKTLLLDNIRSTNIVAGESGGITQHIGAYHVQLSNKKKITFLDTPGHEAFTALRSRGAQVTDFAVLVVAANDGIMPQTVEAINHAKAADTPIIVAINKIDLPEADPDRVQQQLMEYGLVPEVWGGTTIVCPISAKTGQGIDHLLEMILLSAEVHELKTVYDGLANAVVIEAYLDKQRGPITSILVKSGTLQIGNYVAVGDIYGKIRAMINDKGESVTTALPSVPVEVLGLSAVPTPGDMLVVYDNESLARQAAADQVEIKKTQGTQRLTKSASLDTLAQQITDGDVKTLNLIIKADVHGSLDALLVLIKQVESPDVSINVMHAATGNINDNDISLAQASNAIVIGFRVQATGDSRKIRDTHGVDVRLYTIIYEIVTDIERVMSGMHTVSYVESKVGEAEVREVFSFSKVGAIAGCYVTNGMMLRQGIVTVLRKKKSVYKGKLSSLKRFKEDVKQVDSGYECGIVLDGFSGYESGDIIECFRLVEG
jgi:translation initiation factor IF-2